MDFSWSASVFQFPQLAASDDDDDDDDDGTHTRSESQTSFNGTWYPASSTMETHQGQGQGPSVYHHHPTTTTDGTGFGNHPLKDSSPACSWLSPAAINWPDVHSSTTPTGSSFVTRLIGTPWYSCERYRNECRPPVASDESSGSTASGCYNYYDVFDSGVPLSFPSNRYFARSTIDWNPTSGRHNHLPTGNRFRFDDDDHCESRECLVYANKSNSSEFDSSSCSNGPTSCSFSASSNDSCSGESQHHQQVSQNASPNPTSLDECCNNTSWPASTTLADRKQLDSLVYGKPQLQQSGGVRRLVQRTSFSREQLMELKLQFQLKSYVDSTERAMLATSLGLTEKQVKVWFQNRRSKLSRTNRRNLSSSSSPRHIQPQTASYHRDAGFSTSAGPTE